MGVYSLGNIAVTVVDGSSWTGLYASDGSINIVVDDSSHTGVYHPCGAFRVSTSTPAGTYDPSGAFYLNGSFFKRGGGDISIDPVAPANTVAPVVSGTPTSGETLTTTNGTWTGSPSPTFTYQWQADGVDISGAISNSYLLTDSEIGANITCVVTGTNDSGSDTATSNSVGPVEAAAGAVAPASPLMSWATTSSDNTPDFNIDLPSGVGDGTDAAAGDVLHIQYQASGGDWSTPSEYVSYTLLAGDITADTITESGSAVADGDYVFRARLERSGVGNSAWTSDVAVTISTATTATLNPADVGSTITLSGGNLIATSTGSAGPTVRATNSQTTGKRYYEATVNTFAAAEINIGLCTAAHPLTQTLIDTGFGDAYADAVVLRLADQVYSYRTNTPNSSGYFGGGAGTVVGVLADLDAQTLSVTQNGSTYSTPVSFANITAGTALFPVLSLSTSTNEVTCNFGATAYTYSVPTGATNW